MSELGEQNNLLSLTLYFLNQLVKKDHLTTVSDDMLSILISVLVFDTIKHIRMASDFSKLHKCEIIAAFFTSELTQIHLFQ